MSGEQTVTLRIVGESGKLVASTRVAKSELQSLGKAATDTGKQTQSAAVGIDKTGAAAERTGRKARVARTDLAGLGKTSVDAGRQAQTGARGIDGIGAAAERSSRRMSLLGGTLGQIKGLIAGYAGLQGIRELGRAADTYSDIVGKLAMVTKGERELATARATTFALSQKYYQQFDATVTLYSRAAAALAQYKVGQSQVAQLTETINAGLLVSRASTAEAASAVLQLSQALGAGALRGEEFNAVNEAAPRLMQALADSLGVPRGQLKKLAEDGKLTVDVLLKAWTGEQAKKIETEASKVPLTISRAWQQAKNELLRYIGEADQAGGSSARVAQGIQTIARYLPQIISALTTVVTITTAWFVLYRGIPAVVAGLAAVRNAYIGIALAQQMGIRGSGLFAAASVKGLQGITTAAGVLFAAFAGWQIGTWLRENFLEARLFGIAFVNGMLKGWESLKQGALLAWAGIKAYYTGMLNYIREGLAAVVGQWAMMAEILPDFVGGDKIAGSLRNLQAQLTPTTSAADEFAASVASINAEADRNRAQIDQITGEMADYEIEQWNAKKAADAAAASADDQTGSFEGLGDTTDKLKDKLAKLAEAQRAFARENRQMAAQLAGPEAMANFEYTDGVAQANQALAKHEAKLADVAERERLLSQQKKETIAELNRQRDIIGRTNEEYDREVYLSGLSARERRVEEQMLRKADEARELYNQKLRTTKQLLPDEVKALRQTIIAGEIAVAMNARQQRAAEEFRDSWVGAIRSVGAAFGDWVSGGIRSFKDFGRALKDIAKRLLADLVSQFVNNSLVPAIGGWLSQLGGGGGGGGWTSLLKLFGGGGNSGGGGGWGSVLKMFSGNNGGFATAGTGGNWLSSALSTVGSLFGMGGSAGVASGYGSMINGLAATYGGTGVGATAGAAGSAGAGAGAGGAGASTALAAVGWAAAIAYGMYMGAQWYKQGWRATPDQVEEMGTGWGMGGKGVGWTPGQAITYGYTPGMGLALQADKMLQKLGVNQKWAAILSGSSGIVRAFGHKAPKVTGSGISGSVGFGGFEGNAWADIKAKGGWFRGDKKWTEKGAIDPTLDRAFDMAALQISGRAQDLARLLGENISSSLGAVKIDIGKLKLDADPEKARQQIADKVEEVMESLSSAAIKAMGFTRLLDDGFRASEVMDALSASITLVTGGAEKLGRSLTALEKENVTRAVEYFEGLAIKNGTSLGDEVQRVVGTLDEYSKIVTDAEGKIRTSGLNEWQRAQLDIETTYRNQVRSLNALAKSLGLSGARAEDLAKIEQLRALNMANLQKQMEAQRDTFLQDLGLSELSPLTDQQKLTESMQLLRDAVGAGDLSRAQSLSQTALGLGRNLFASGNDYNSLYNEVTGLLGGIGLPSTVMDDGTNMGDLADILLDLPQQIATALFNTLYTPATPPPVTTTTATTPGTNAGPVGGTNGGTTDQILQQAVNLLGIVARNTGSGARSSEFAQLNAR